ncbi:hypothetical protein [Chroococcus sp. FPU101]|nr:hypothetical protein [Chroococcus sp. FPU101]GFE70043.1 hypothetical protein CFPU101_26530 [Chroococcus sp. FPU101]
MSSKSSKYSRNAAIARLREQMIEYYYKNIAPVKKMNEENEKRDEITPSN